MKLLSRSRSRVMAEVTAPPPTAITALVSSKQAGDHPLLERPEGAFAVVAEDRADRFGRLRLDLDIGIEEPPAQPLGQAHTGGGLARAHEPDQHQVSVRAGNHARAMRSR